MKQCTCFKNVVIVCNIIKGIQSYLWVQIPIYIMYQDTWYMKKAIIGHCLAVNHVHCPCFFTFTFCCKQPLLPRLLADDWAGCSVSGGVCGVGDVWGVSDGCVWVVDDCSAEVWSVLWDAVCDVVTLFVSSFRGFQSQNKMLNKTYM